MSRHSKAPIRPYRICNRCVMDTTDPWIRFDPEGHCNHCSDFLERRLSVTAYRQASNSDGRLEKLFDQARRIRSAGSKYDVAIGVSGGVDSSATVLLAQRAGLRVLAVHMDNGWDTPIAIRNIQRLINLSGVSYHAEVLDWNNFKRIQRAFLEAGVPDIELPTDIAIQAALHRAAARHGISTILSGGNVANEGILPAAWLYNARDSRYAQSILTQAGLPRSAYSPIKFGFREELKARLLKKIRTLYPLNQFRYDKASARDQLRDAIGWQSYGGKHCESTFTRFTQLIYLPRRHNADYRRGYLSADICLGTVTRDEALRQLSIPASVGLDVDHDIAFVARKLDYTISDLKDLMQRPPRWYHDYPHLEKQLGFAYNTFRLFTGRRKASNF